jgi:hypothetical protein
MLHKITLVIFLTMIYLGAISQEITGFVKDKKIMSQFHFQMCG